MDLPTYQTLKTETAAPHVLLVTLNRPEIANALNTQMGRDFFDLWTRLTEDSGDIRCVVLTGAGDKVFCAGADLKERVGMTREQWRRQHEIFERHYWALTDLPLPVIAAVNGHAIGLGLTLALQCDIRLFARDAKYGVLQVRRGVMPDAYAHFTLPRIVGFARAADLLLTGRKVQGEEAVTLGLASRALPADEVLPAALEIARDIATHTAPLSVAVTKRLLWESGSLDAAAVERKETALHHHLMGREDAREGVMAYLERRTPHWQLRVSRDWPDWPD